MARLLEELQSGTPVFDRKNVPVGEVRAVYALGEARGAEYLLVYWTARGEEALLPADEVIDLTDQGITLAATGPSYSSLAAFSPSDNPELHRL